MKLISPLPHKRGRLEIIPLIDIMFFLLAAFMVVSLNKIKVESLKVNLPTNVAGAQKETKEDFISISLAENGQLQVDKEILPNRDALKPKLTEIYRVNRNQKFLISADQEVREGDVMRLLGDLRAAGFQRVAFSVKTGTLNFSEVSPSALPSSAPALAPGVIPPPNSAGPTHSSPINPASTGASTLPSLTPSTTTPASATSSTATPPAAAPVSSPAASAAPALALPPAPGSH